MSNQALRYFAGALLAIGALSGCGARGDDAAQDQEKRADVNAPPIPTIVQQAMAVEFPADGEIHTRAKGRFDIRPETSVCYLPGGIFVDPTELFNALGQNPNLPSGSRLQPTADGRCPASNDGVFNSGLNTDNRTGGPYKLVLAVWQGPLDAKGQPAAFWVGGVERLEGRWHPKLNLDFIPDDFLDSEPEPPRTEEQKYAAYVIGSSGLDIRDVSNAFIKYIARGIEK